MKNFRSIIKKEFTQTLKKQYCEIKQNGGIITQGLYFGKAKMTKLSPTLENL